MFHHRGEAQRPARVADSAYPLCQQQELIMSVESDVFIASDFIGGGQTLTFTLFGGGGFPPGGRRAGRAEISRRVAVRRSRHPGGRRYHAGRSAAVRRNDLTNLRVQHMRPDIVG